MHLPPPRGPASSAVFQALRAERAAPQAVHPVDDDDLQIALWALYHQHYRGFDDVADELEWDPALLAVRARLEDAFEQRLRRDAEPLIAEAKAAAPDIVGRLQHLAELPGPSVPGFLHREASAEQLRDYLATRSVYFLHEADPYTWTLPRLTGKAKAALAELQYDEYGGGSADRLHQGLFARALVAAGLSDDLGEHLHRAGAETLAFANALSLLGLHRRHAAASMGHLALLEMTSSLPCRRVVQGAQRLGLPPDVIRYFDEHVEADAVHEQVASRDICGTLVAEDPRSADGVLFGAAVCVLLGAAESAALLGRWQDEPGSRDGALLAVPA